MKIGSIKLSLIAIAFFLSSFQTAYAQNTGDNNGDNTGDNNGVSFLDIQPFMTIIAGMGGGGFPNPDPDPEPENECPQGMRPGWVRNTDPDAGSAGVAVFVWGCVPKDPEVKPDWPRHRDPVLAEILEALDSIKLDDSNQGTGNGTGEGNGTGNR